MYVYHIIPLQTFCNELLWSAVIHPIDHCLPIDDFLSLLSYCKLTTNKHTAGT